MKHIVRRILLVVGVVVLTACTPTQVQRWWEWHARDPVAADAYVDQLRTNPPPGECAEWYWNALEAGFTADQWPTVDQIMFGESRCYPDAQSNISSAAGLMQELWQWADDCAAYNGTDIQKAWFYNPDWNLRCAVLIHSVQGWGAWSAWDGTVP